MNKRGRMSVKNIDAQNQLCSEYSNGIYIPIDLAEQTRW
jgi:hypothetical protein